MAEDYPYMMSNNKIAEVMDRMEKAAKPDRLSHPMLKTWGFTSSNDRAVIPLFKRLGILDQNGAPTPYYDDVKDPATRAVTIAQAIRECYSELYEINTSIHEANDQDVKGAMARVTGKDAKSIDRYYNTFKRLVSLADFQSAKIDVSNQPTFTSTPEPIKLTEKQNANQPSTASAAIAPANMKTTEFHYNIQIHLPATTDISVYNAIFKALKDNLDVG